ncbi:hypothetical protein PMAC_003402 [Pneumocystis sp. 'macacae']|nr:hypothetical protein PMAC_003402 [Pneumocystis sp. 'macacae']
MFHRPHFDPTRPEPTVMEKVGKPLERDPLDLLLKCKSIEYLEEETKALTTRIENKHFKKDDYVVGNLPDVLMNMIAQYYNRTVLLWKINDLFEKLCKNVKAGKSARKFNNHDTWPKTFPKDLINKEQGDICIMPAANGLYFVLLTYLNINANILQKRNIWFERDLPTGGSALHGLKNEFGEARRMAGLRHHCARLGVAEHLEEVLQEKVSDLDKFESCVETLRGRCSGWGDGGGRGTRWVCRAERHLHVPHGECRVEVRCIEGTYGNQQSFRKCKKMMKEATCRRWMPFCNKFMYSCKNLTAMRKYCKGLEEQCRSFIKQQLEEKTKATNSLGNKKQQPNLMRQKMQHSLDLRRNKAFDLVSQALSLYVELKEECQDLLKDCGFKEECEGWIETIGETSTTTTTTTTTTTIVGSEAGKAGTEQCTSIRTTDTTSTSTSTITSTVTLTSTRKCRPTKCTTEGEEAGEVKPSGALRMRGWGVMKGCCWG